MNENDEERAIYQSMITALYNIRDSKSPPKAQVDEASLQQAMDKNKESLKMKLLNRRPINQLVDQGIMPSPKVPPHYYEQRQKLERAKMGDFLKNKIQRRPDRQALIQQHILEDTKIDPSLQDKQRQLKKARLADDLNDRLSHRPGPLELVKGNILQADEKFAQAVKEGQIPFKRTCEGQALRHPLPCFTFEEDSGSDVALSPQDLLDQSLSSMPSMETMVLSPYTNQDSPSNSLGELRINSGTPPASVPSPTSSQSGCSSVNEIPPKENVSVVRRKKPKPKAQPKPRTIKFHEYKGPPNAQKNQLALNDSETSYELLLQQQQLFLQWQLEWQQKYPHQMILPVTKQQPTDQSKSANSGQSILIEKQPDTPPSPPRAYIKNLEDMKVNSLKAELKRRNLPVSGSKGLLLERLKNHLEATSNVNKAISDKNVTVDTTAVPINVSGIILDTLPTLVTQSDAVTSVVTVEAPLNNRTSHITVKEEPTLMVYNTLPIQGQLVASRPSSTAPMDVEINANCDVMDCSDGSNIINDDIVKRQQQKILQLQRELQRSQLQLQQQQWLQHQQQQAQQAQQQALLASHPVPIAPAPPANQTSLPQANVDKALEQLHKHIQQKIQQQQLIQQAGKFASGSAAKSAIVKANLAAHIHNQQANTVRLPNGLALNQQNIASYANLKPIVLCQAQAVPGLVDKPRANSLPNGMPQQKLVWSSSVPNFSNIAPKMAVRTVEPKLIIHKAPPDYNEAIKPQTKAKQSGSRNRKKSVKSQEVDDVLDVLIKNGELPPSAAQDPITPTTPETQKGVLLGPPVFPKVDANPGELKQTLVKLNSPEQITLPTAASSNTVQQNNISEPNLVYDLNLDLQDLDTMDLSVLDRSDPLEPTQSFQKSESFQQPPMQNMPNSSNGDIDMDVDFSDWLDILTNNNTVSNSNQSRGCSYNSDPLLSTMDSSQDTLDMFSLDNLDFRTQSDANLLSWE